MNDWLGFLVLGGVVGVILYRTPGGRRFVARLRGQPSTGSPTESPRAASNEDHAFLLDKCGGDEDDLLRRLEVEVRRNPNLDEAQAYRRAIRSWFQEKRGGTHGTPGGEDSEGSDTWL